MQLLQKFVNIFFFFFWKRRDLSCLCICRVYLICKEFHDDKAKLTDNFYQIKLFIKTKCDQDLYNAIGSSHFDYRKQTFEAANSCAKLKSNDEMIYKIQKYMKCLLSIEHVPFPKIFRSLKFLLSVLFMFFTWFCNKKSFRFDESVIWFDLFCICFLFDK